jgi:ABC-2 type transport system ATP-binding protein
VAKWLGVIYFASLAHQFLFFNFLLLSLLSISCRYLAAIFMRNLEGKVKATTLIRVKSIIAEDLVKSYDKGKVKALDGLSLDVSEGTVLALLGPNGAGKTTTVRVLSTLLIPDSGRASVAGIDVIKYPDKVREIIGLSGQYAAVDETLTGWDNLVMFGRLYHLSSSATKVRATELLEQFNLTDAAKRPIRTYSGGMRRRLDLAASLIVRPKILFLDEPTTGLDPRGRQEMWGVIKNLVKGGTTLLLTTQYLEEADQLADDIAVVDHGKVIARGSSDELKREVGGERLELVVEEADIARTREIVAKVAMTNVVVDDDLRQISAPVTSGSKALIEAARALDEAGIHPLDIALKRPSLDDVFIALTGHVAEEQKEEEAPAKGRRNR